MMRYLPRFFLPLGIGIIGCIIFITTGCDKKDTKVAEEKVINVLTSPVEKRSLRPFIETIGTLIPNEEVVISAEVEGVLKGVRVDEGTMVSEGGLLAVINDADYNLEAKRAEAALRQAEASLSNTIVEHKRKEALYKEDLLTKEEFDDLSTRLSLAEAELDKVKASLSLAKQRLSKTKIYSPISGVVSKREVSAGDFVKNGTPLFKVIQSDPIKLILTVPEKDVGRLKAGQDVFFKVDPFPGKEFKGRLNIIYPSLDEKTRTLQAEAVTPNPQGLLRPGLFASATIYTGMPKETVVVPVTAILYEAEKAKVFTVEEERAREKGVKPGNKYGDMMEIVEGLKEGDKVVIAGQQNLSEGVKVRGNVAR